MPRQQRPNNLPSIIPTSSTVSVQPSGSPSSNSSSSSTNIKYGRHAATVRQLKRRGRKDAWGYFIFPPRPERSVSLINIQRLTTIDRRGTANQKKLPEEDTDIENPEFFVSPLRRSFSIRRRSRKDTYDGEIMSNEFWGLENGAEHGDTLISATSGMACHSELPSLSRYDEAFFDGVTSVCTVDSSRITPIPSDNEVDKVRITRALASLDLRTCFDSNGLFKANSYTTDIPHQNRSTSLTSVSTESDMSICANECRQQVEENVDVQKDPLCDSQPRPPDGTRSALKVVHIDVPHVDGSKASQVKLVVGIDIGSYSSGYAIGVAPNGHVHRIMDIPEGGDPGVSNFKIPSCILLCPRLQFHSFGYIARDFYHDLDRNEAETWCFVDFSTNRLHSRTSVHLGTTMTANNGKEISLVKILAMTLKYFRFRILEEMANEWQEGIMTESDILWVIAAPSAWDCDSQMVLEAAAKEGGLVCSMRPGQIVITSESEAAAVYCRTLAADEILLQSYPRFSPRFLKRRTKQDEQLTQTDEKTILVVDCGGENVHLTVFRVSGSTSTMQEITRIPNASLGSKGVDHQFEKLLSEMFGSQDLAAFQRVNPLDFVRLLSAFESRKRVAYNFAYDSTAHHNIALPLSLMCFCRKNKRQSVRKIVRHYGDRGVFYTKQGMLCLTSQRMQDLFQLVLDRLQQALESVLNRNPEIALMFVVGGFANSPILQQDIVSHFSERLEIVFPKNPETVIMKGSLLFGLIDRHPTHIQPRHSYGIGILRKFIDSHHPQNKRLTISSVSADECGWEHGEIIQKDWCADQFDVFVRANESIVLDEPIARTYTPCTWGEKSLCISIYRSESPNVQFITEDGVEKCADLKFDVSCSAYSAMKRKLIQVRMTFTEAGLLVTAKDLCDIRSISTAIDWRCNSKSSTCSQTMLSNCGRQLSDNEPTAYL